MSAHEAIQSDDHASRTAADDAVAPNTPHSVSLPRLILRGIWRPLAVLLILALLISIVQPARLVSEVSEWREWILEQGIWGILLFLGLYMLAAVAIVPQAVLKVAAGGLFGGVLGLIVASAGSTLGATACFLIARYVRRGTLMTYLRSGRQFRRVDALTTEHGAMVVLLARLVPILPGNLINYAFGLTQVRLGTFVFWSWLGMLPGTIVLVIGTDAFVRGISERRVPWGMLTIVACALTLLVMACIYAQGRFRMHMAHEDANGMANNNVETDADAAHD